MNWFYQTQLFFILFFSPISFLLASSQVTHYQMGDLKILAGEKNYQEFFKHVLDIKPAKRSREWKEMAKNLGLDYLNDVLAKHMIEKKDWQLIYKISHWPIFKNDEFFIAKRDLIFNQQLKECFKSSTRKQCFEQALKIYLNFKHEITYSFDLLKILAKQTNNSEELWPFAKKLAANNISEFYCHKSPLKKIIIDRIYYFVFQNQSLIKNIHPDCFQKIQSEFENNLLDQKKQLRQAAFKALLEYGKLTKKQQSLYYTYLFLNENDLENKDVDKSLKYLKELKENPLMREENLKQLSKQDPLPGRLFQVGPKGEAKLRILLRHFPEYLDYYTKTCVSYLTGSQKFPHGNPTPQCHDLFTLNKKLKFIPLAQTKKYEKATYFLNNKAP